MCRGFPLAPFDFQRFFIHQWSMKNPMILLMKPSKTILNHGSRRVQCLMQLQFVLSKASTPPRRPSVRARDSHASPRYPVSDGNGNGNGDSMVHMGQIWGYSKLIRLIPRLGTVPCHSGGNAHSRLATEGRQLLGDLNSLSNQKLNSNSSKSVEIQFNSNKCT